MSFPTTMAGFLALEPPEPFRATFARLLRDVPGSFLSFDQVELFHYAVYLLLEQERIDDVVGSSTGRFGLQKHELVWTALYDFLNDYGYKLSARYKPGWRQRGTPSDRADHEYRRHPDSEPLDEQAFRTARVTCTRTGQPAILKILFTRPCHTSAREIDILRFLNSEPLRSHPHNICVPVHTFIECPSLRHGPPGYSFSLAVMPCLRHFDVADCGIAAFSLHVMKQGLEGLAFLHAHGIAHRDITFSNIVVSQHGPPFRLYFIDFGLSTHIEPECRDHRVTWTGGRLVPPEVSSKSSRADTSMLYDPFKADVYAIARAFDMCTVPARLYFADFEEMLFADSPAERPTASECVLLFEQQLNRLPWRLYYRRALRLRTSQTVGGCRRGKLVAHRRCSVSLCRRRYLEQVVKRVTPLLARTRRCNK